jgi:hypothetical protein
MPHRHQGPGQAAEEGVAEGQTEEEGNQGAVEPGVAEREVRTFAPQR